MTLGSWTTSDESPDRRRRVLWSLPTVLAVLGTVDEDGGPHLMNLSWVTPAANEPTRLIASLEVTSKSARNLRRDPVWSLSLLPLDQRSLGRAFVKPALVVRHDDEGELVHEQRIDRTSRGAPYLQVAAAAFAGATGERLTTLDDHELWLLRVDEVTARAELTAGPASTHDIKILGVHDTRLNYGR